MVWVIIILLAGIIIGLILSKLIFRPKPIGYLRVDHSDSEPYLFLELNDSLGESILCKKYVTLKVCVKNYISQK